MVQRLANDSAKLKMYNDVIATQEKQGFIEKVGNPHIFSIPCHNIPHHAAIKESSTTPLRIVYDCSCRKSPEHPSLNDCLTTGPPILNDLIAILLRFCQSKYGLSADIEKGFLNLILDEEDRDATRFFWISNPDNPTSPFDVYRFKRILFGATSSPFILNATLDKHLKQFNHPVAERIREDIYVDDLVSGAQDDHKAVTFYTNAQTLMLPGGFNLRSWSSNNEAVKTIAAEENLLNDNPKPKVLGMKWDTTNDTLLYPNRVTISKVNPATKREVLRTSSKIYDPIGFLNPVVVNAKILMQEIWKKGLQWDEPLPPKMQVNWEKQAKELESSTHVQLARQYFPATSRWPEDAELHIFVDASLKAYGAVAYVKSSEANHSLFVMARSRVAPLKKLTLPQLELTAASIGSRLCSYLEKKLQVSGIFLWTDSQIVLHWLHSNKQLKPYVTNRISEIKTLTPIGICRYCPTEDNPSDLLTRGITADQLDASEIWRHGPTWLLAAPEMWPSWTPSTHLFLAETADLRNKGSDSATPEDAQKQPGLHHLIQISKFSCLSRLVNITAYVIRFAKNCRDKRQIKETGLITPLERDEATCRLIQNTQRLTYHNEVSSLSSKTAKRVPLVRQIRLFKKQIRPSSFWRKNTQRASRRINKVPNTSSTEK